MVTEPEIGDGGNGAAEGWWLTDPLVHKAAAELPQRSPRDTQSETHGRERT